MKYCNNTFSHHVLANQREGVEDYCANSSYKVVQTSFRRKFQCRHALSKNIIFDWIQKFKEYGTAQTLSSKGLRNTYSDRMVSARTQRNIDAVRDSNAVEAIWSIFRKKHYFYAKRLQ